VSLPVRQLQRHNRHAPCGQRTEHKQHHVAVRGLQVQNSARTSCMMPNDGSLLSSTRQTLIECSTRRETFSYLSRLKPLSASSRFPCRRWCQELPQTCNATIASMSGAAKLPESSRCSWMISHG
jgi:hypothetical protein